MLAIVKKDKYSLGPRSQAPENAKALVKRLRKNSDECDHGDELPRVAWSLYGLFSGLHGHELARNT